jgi:multisubunit Na+/H+ antiporter MnhE subunit
VTKIKTIHDFLVIITTNLRRIIMNESRVEVKESREGFYAGCAGGFGFYLAWQCVSFLWLTTTQQETTVKFFIGLAVGLVIGALLYLGVHTLLTKRYDITNTKGEIRYTLFGIVTGLVIGFLAGLLLNNLGVFTLHPG